MENNGRLRAGAEAVQEETRAESLTATAKAPENASTLSILDDQEMQKKLEASLGQFRESIDSPKTLLIARNVVLTLLELEGELSLQKAYLLIADREFRNGIVRQLVAQTPEYWSETWDASWIKDLEPLYSKLQQRIARRRSLISFWTLEFEALPSDQLQRLAETISSLSN